MARTRAYRLLQDSRSATRRAAEEVQTNNFTRYSATGQPVRQLCRENASGGSCVTTKKPEGGKRGPELGTRPDSASRGSTVRSHAVISRACARCFPPALSLARPPRPGDPPRPDPTDVDANRWRLCCSPPPSRRSSPPPPTPRSPPRRPPGRRPPPRAPLLRSSRSVVRSPLTSRWRRATFRRPFRTTPTRAGSGVRSLFRTGALRDTSSDPPGSAPVSAAATGAPSRTAPPSDPPVRSPV